MDIVNLEDVGLITSPTEYISNISSTQQIVSQDGSINIDSGELSGYCNTITYVTLPDIIQVVLEDDPQNVSYLVNNNQIPILNGALVVDQDALVEVSATEDTNTTESIQDLSKYLNSSTLLVHSDKNNEKSSNTSESACSSTLKSADNRISSNEKHPPSDKPIVLTCGSCNLNFSSWKLYRKHKLNHIAEKPYKCNECMESFNYELNLNLHKAIHDVNNPFCPVCKKRFRRVAGLKAHILLHGREESLFCTECGDEFSSHDHLKKHTAAEHCPGASGSELGAAEKVYPCYRCDKVYESMENRKVHMLKTHRIFNKNKRKPKKIKYLRKTNRCEFCDKYFEKPSQLLRHKRTHTGERPYQCSVCKRAFSQKGSLQIHMLKHTKEKPFVCEYCYISFSQKGNLLNHVKRLHAGPGSEGRTHKCHLCPCTFMKPGRLSAHVTKVHADSIPPEVNNPPSVTTKDTSDVQTENPHSNRCGECDMLCENSEALEVFEFLLHLEEKSFPCSLCDKRFATEAELKEHDETHYYAQELFQCSLCSETFQTESECMVHAEKCPLPSQNSSEKKKVRANWRPPARILTDEEAKILAAMEPENASTISEKVLLQSLQEKEKFGKPKVNVERENVVYQHQCMYCTKSFKKLSDLVRHVRTHTGERPYECVSCNKRFSVKSTADSHMKTHTKDKSFECYLCSKPFSTISSLRVHMRLHTGLKPYSCHLCDAKFRTLGHRKAHLSKHMNDNSKTKGSSKKNKDISHNKSVEKTSSPNSLEDGSSISVPLNILNNSNESVVNQNEFFPTLTTLENDLPKTRSKEPKFLLSINDEGDGNGENPKYIVSIQEGGVDEDGFLVDALNENHIVVTVTKGDSLIDQRPSQTNGFVQELNTSLEIYSCTVCNQILSSQGQLSRHMKDCHDDQIFQCTVCSENFEKKQDLDLHSLAHELDQVFTCTVCAESFSHEEESQAHKCKGATVDLSLDNDLFLFPQV